jgi:hypothetical protein
MDPLPKPSVSSVPPEVRRTAAKSVRYLNGDHVRDLGLSSGIPSDEALARAAGLSYGHLWSCLAGRRAAGPKVLAGLLRALPGTTLRDLVGPAGPGDVAVSA